MITTSWSLSRDHLVVITKNVVAYDDHTVETDHDLDPRWRQPGLPYRTLSCHFLG
ncbi:hypothetical protein [Rubripirellula amarantea]|uniref:hypothetical protein n=1 Tax=Rubripirellula amarantea TaxID=2527999 RepID=UPI0013EEF2E4|nr:hypothetical protein [Rubripirellula amarantea]